MSNTVEEALAYFRAPSDSFWRWADEGEVIEWRDGETLCYREDLISLLHELYPSGLPPVGTALLLLAACRESRSDFAAHLPVLYERITQAEESDARDALQLMFDDAVYLLGLVSNLPEELRQGVSRTHLLYEICTEQSLFFPGSASQSLLREFQSGRLDQIVFTPGGRYTDAQVRIDFRPLVAAFKRFPDQEQLEALLRTGLEKTPALLPPKATNEEEDSKEEDSEQEPADLLDQLAKEPRTLGVSRLTRRLIAALHIPRHARDTGEQPLGGIADISNRGEIDRLLLSELAHDDEWLTARLVNNEALFYRREIPPVSVPRRRTLLVDTTLRMWGVSRVFATSAALAFAHELQGAAPLQAFALGGAGTGRIDLRSKAGVIDALEHLHPALHCGAALTSCLRFETASETEERIFITEAENLKIEPFRRALNEVGHLLRFLVLVSRSGELQFFQYVNGRRKALGTTRYDLDSLLFSPDAQAVSRKVVRKDVPAIAPAFLHQVVLPLRFPTMDMRINPQSCMISQGGVIGLTTQQRLLYWPKQSKAALELMPFVPGTCCFGYDSQKNKYYVWHDDTDKDVRRIYHATADEGIVEVIELPDRISSPLLTAFVDQTIELITREQFLTLDAATGETLSEVPRSPALDGEWDRRQGTNLRFQKNAIKQFINNGYSVLQRIEKMWVNTEGNLVLGNRSLVMDAPHNSLVISHNKTQGRSSHWLSPQKEPAVNFGIHHPHLQVAKVSWPDGTDALVDPRGFLHLISSDASLPEVSLVLILNQGIAAWASDGHVCGADYFIADNISTQMDCGTFYATYLQPIIDLIRHAT